MFTNCNKNCYITIELFGGMNLLTKNKKLEENIKTVKIVLFFTKIYDCLFS